MNKMAEVGLALIGGVIIWNYLVCPIIGAGVIVVQDLINKHEQKEYENFQEYLKKNAGVIEEDL